MLRGIIEQTHQYAPAVLPVGHLPSETSSAGILSMSRKNPHSWMKRKPTKGGRNTWPSSAMAHSASC